MRPGYYWAKWRIPAEGTFEGESMCPMDTWEIVQVNDNAVYWQDNPMESEALSVSVPGVRETQWRDGFVWGDYVADLNGPAPAPTTADDAEREAGRLREAMFVPGLWQCPTCKFQLIKQTMSVAAGVIGTTEADRREPELCPNDCRVTLERVTWREEAESHMDQLARLKSEAYAIPAEPAALAPATPAEPAGDDAGRGVGK